MTKLTLAIGAAASLMLVASAYGQSNSYRQVDSDGVGNCLFSTSMLNRGEEGGPAYRAARTQFSDGDNVFVRCYFAKPLGQYTRSGRLQNSLRSGEYFADLELRDPPRSSQGPDVVGGMRFDYDPSEAGFDQQRFDIGEVSDCDFRLPAYDARTWGVGESRCPDLTRLTRTIGQKRGASFPFTATYCVKVYYQFADVIDERREYDGNTSSVRVNRSPRLMDHRIAESCFDYTVSG